MSAEWMTLIREVKKQRQEIAQGGGAANIEKQHRKGRLTARERIDLLVDKKSAFYELSQFAAFGMYEEWGGAPSAGVVTGLGYVEQRLCMIIANDATVKAGSFFPMTAKKVIRAQTIAMENHIPVLYLVDSAGIFLPLQEDVFPDQDDFGRVFYLNARMSALGIPQITAIMGMCVAGGAYLPVMTDTVLMTEGSGLFLAGPALVKAAIGQEVSAEELGGAGMHAALSGTIDFKEKDDPAAIGHMRKLVALMPEVNPVKFKKSRDAHYPEPLTAVVPVDTSAKTYDVRDVLARIIDGSELVEYKKEYGQTLVCGYAHIGGYPVGIVANQKKHILQKGQPPQFGGVIYKESAEKAARFIMDCNQKKIPLLFVHDVNGFMVGREAEQSGIIKAGAKMVNAVSNSVVPKISLIIGGSFGAGNYAMCGKAYAPNFIYAWPNAHYAVMGGAQAANTLAGIKIKQMERGGRQLSAEDRNKIIDEIKAAYQDQSTAQYAAARLWVDEIILPAETRDRLILSLEAVNLNPHITGRLFNPGVIQT
ncbi:MAG TPA: acyl-CoA carboxylase subunit beta [Caldithrix abyssi]|uniref:Acyl-CoA carboxylase subunit beta n=1 Tax=Caldithrix abyssi TaxID=187145 RepID=A0A7V1PVX4_CALAY|nr:acyl-CoA carboxylase subunit beta [Caldithrix abyssi]